MNLQQSIYLSVTLVTALTVSSFFLLPKKQTEKQGQQSGFYDLSNPVSVQTLPAELIEVSGLTDLSAHKIACVQDEKGIIYSYDLLSQKITHQFSFAPDSDYEGLTRVKDVLYTLSSDGTLFETTTTRKEPQTRSYTLNLPSTDNEGLCYDEKNNRLLIAPKSKIGKGAAFKDTRAIFVFDLRKKELQEEPLFYFSIDELYAVASRKGIEPTPSLKKNGEPKIQQNFRPSSLAVHPETGDIFVISAEDFGLVIFSETGVVKDYFALDPNCFEKPEGITFLPNGQMIITNEGVNGDATLLVFEPA